VRELENAIEHAFVICRGNIIQIEHLPERILDAVHKAGKSHCIPFNGGSSEEAIIHEALVRNKGNRNKTARELGMHRATLWRKMSKYRLTS
jgi:transcriptional regulator of acetoin/glycerol metabolism